MSHTLFLKKILVTSVLLVVLLVTQVSVAFAYSVAPLVIDKELEKRDIQYETITLTNKGAGLVRIYPTVNEVAVDAGGTVQTFVEPSMVEDRGSSITTWLEITRGRIELQPGETKEIQLTIKVSPDAKPGEYHAFVGFPTGSNRPEAERQVMEGNAPGTIVRIGVDKVQNQFLRLEKFVVERFVKSSTEGEVQFGLKNPGEDAVIPGGEIIFYDNNGNEVNSVPINSEGTIIEGGQSLSFIESVPNDLVMGKYKAFLSVEYGEHQTASLHDTAFFYVLPIKLIIIIFVVVLILAIALALFVHRKYDRDDEDDGVALVSMYIRESKSESKEHDIDLSKKNLQ